MLNNINHIHLELTEKCNKDCWMCGRKKIERDTGKKYNREIDFELLESIAKQLPPNIVIQFHNNGEGLLYPRFGEALKLFKNQIKCLTTNGKLLVAKADEIIDNLDTLAISIIENEDPKEKKWQDKQIKKFLELKGDRKPFVIYRLLGEVDETQYNGLIVKRTIHAPKKGFVGYRNTPTIPETGICWDFLNRPTIDADGNVVICVALDPDGLGIIGNLKEQTLEEIWNSKKRLDWLELHKQGQRSKVPLCNKCEYWGVPVGRVK